MRRVFLVLALMLGMTQLARAQQKWTLSAAASTCSTSNTSCLIYLVDAASGGATFTVSANSGNTIQFEATGDGGTTWVALNATPSNSTTAATSTTSTGTWQANVAGYTAVRMRMSTLSSGTTTVSIVTSLASARANGGAGGAALILTQAANVYASGTNTAGSDTNFLYVSAFSGADLGAQINNCTAALKNSVGTCFVSNLGNVSQTLSTAVTVPANVTLAFQSGTQVSQSGAVTLSNANSSVVCPADQSVTFTKAGNIDQFTLSAGQTSIVNCTLVGVSGSFTGRGIVGTVAGAQAINNNVSGEAGNGIDMTGGSALLNAGSSTTTGHPIAVTGGIALFNGFGAGGAVTTTHSDAIYVKSNNNTVETNKITLSPAALTSGLCAINFNDDQLFDTSRDNYISIQDTTNSGNVDNGVCFTPTGTHNLGMLSSGDRVSGTTSGSVTTNAFFLNNAAGLNTNWSVIVEDLSCVHMTNALKRTDAQNNASVYSNIQSGDCALDAGTGSTNDKFIMDNANSSFANLPSPSGAGSRIYCTGCNPGKVSFTSTGGVADVVYKTASGWTTVHPPVMQLTSSYTNATTTPSNIPGLSFQAAANTNYSFICWANWSASANTAGLDITITGPTSPTLAVYSYTEIQNGAVAVQSNNTSTLGTKLTGTTTLTTTQGIALITLTLLNGANTGAVQVQGSATGAGTVSITEDAACSPVN